MSMVSKISILIILVIKVFTNGNPAYRQNSYEERKYDLKKFLENIVKQGSYNYLLNRHQDRPGHLEDTTKTTYNGGIRNSHFFKHRNSDYYKDTSDNLNYKNQLSSQTLNLFLNKLRSLRTEQKKDCMKNWGSCVEIVWNDSAAKITPTSDREREDDDTKKVTNSKNGCGVLPELDVNEKEQRCNSNNCGESTDDGNRNSVRDFSANRDYKDNIVNKNNDRHLRCNGKSCSIDRDNDRRERYSLRCNGNKCNRKTRHEDRVKRYDDRKNRFNTKDDKYNDRNRLQCIWDRFGRERTALEKNLYCIENKHSDNLNTSDVKYIVKKSAVESLDRKLEVLLKVKEMNHESDIFTQNLQTRELVKQLRKGLLELLDFHFGQERDPNDRFFQEDLL